MQKYILTKEIIQNYEKYLKREEKSENTINKYLRDVRAFSDYMAGAAIEKERVIAYKQYLLDADYAPCSINFILASLNSFFVFLGWLSCKVKSIKLQRQIYCSEEKELTKAEYIRLVRAAQKKGEERLLSYVKSKNITSGAIFITRSGKPMSRTNIWREMKNLCLKAEVNPNKVFPHNLRHLFARIFYGIKKDIAKLADILGHSSINTTRIYIVSSGTEHRKCIESMRLII